MSDKKPSAYLEDLSSVLLEQSATAGQLSEALDQFVQICMDVGGVAADPAFDAWAGDSFLPDGVAIAPQAAAHCARDYQRTAIFIRGVHAAIEQAKSRFPNETLQLLYAGCGPYATLLLPLLTRYDPIELDVCLLDIHQESLASVGKLLDHFGLTHYAVKKIQADACTYCHPHPLHLVVTETMQKSLEQEPQFAITAQLAPQLRDGGIFIPQKIDVRLCLNSVNGQRGSLECTESPAAAIPNSLPDHYELCTLLSLTPEHVGPLLRSATGDKNQSKRVLQPVVVEIPAMPKLDRMNAALFTRIQAFGNYWLEDYDTEITLPQPCTDMSPLVSGERWEISYELGRYPRFNVRKATGQN